MGQPSHCHQGQFPLVWSGLIPRLGANWFGSQGLCLLTCGNTPDWGPAIRASVSILTQWGCLPSSKPCTKARRALPRCLQSRNYHTGPKETFRMGGGRLYPHESLSGGFALVSEPVAKAERPRGPLARLLFLLPAASVSLRLLDTKQLSR